MWKMGVCVTFLVMNSMVYEEAPLRSVLYHFKHRIIKQSTQECKIKLECS